MPAAQAACYAASRSRRTDESRAARAIAASHSLRPELPAPPLACPVHKGAGSVISPSTASSICQIYGAFVWGETTLVIWVAYDLAITKGRSRPVGIATPSSPSTSSKSGQSRREEDAARPPSAATTAYQSRLPRHRLRSGEAPRSGQGQAPLRGDDIQCPELSLHNAAVHLRGPSDRRERGPASGETACYAVAQATRESLDVSRNLGPTHDGRPQLQRRRRDERTVESNRS